MCQEKMDTSIDKKTNLSYYYSILVDNNQTASYLFDFNIFCATRT